MPSENAMKGILSPAGRGVHRTSLPLWVQRQSWCERGRKVGLVPQATFVGQLGSWEPSAGSMTFARASITMVLSVHERYHRAEGLVRWSAVSPRFLQLTWWAIHASWKPTRWVRLAR